MALWETKKCPSLWIEGMQHTEWRGLLWPQGQRVTWNIPGPFSPQLWIIWVRVILRTEVPGLRQQRMIPLQFAPVYTTWRSREDANIAGYSSISYLAPVQPTALFHSLFKDSGLMLYSLKGKSFLLLFFSWLVLCLTCGQLRWEGSKLSAGKKYCCLETNDVVPNCYW